MDAKNIKQGGVGWCKWGAILVWVLSWKLQPHYKWRHPECVDCQTNDLRKARRGATPRLCDSVPSLVEPSHPPHERPSSLTTVASSSSQRLNINGWGLFHMGDKQSGAKIRSSPLCLFFLTVCLAILPPFFSPPLCLSFSPSLSLALSSAL